MRSGDVFASMLLACLLMLAAPHEAAASDAPLVVDSAGSAAQTLPAAAPWQEIRAGDRVRLTNDRGAVFYGTVTRVKPRELVLDWLDQGMSLRFARSQVARIELRDRHPSIFAESENEAPVSVLVDSAPFPAMRIRLLDLTIAAGGGRDTNYYDRFAYPVRSESLHVRVAYGARPTENRGAVVVAEAAGAQETQIGRARCWETFTPSCVTPDGTETWTLVAVAARVGYHGYASGFEVGWSRFEAHQPYGVVRGEWPSVRGWSGHRNFYAWFDTAGAIHDASSMPARFGFAHRAPRAHVRIGAVVNGEPIQKLVDGGLGLSADLEAPLGDFVRVGLDLRTKSSSRMTAQLRVVWSLGRARSARALPQSALQQETP